MNKNYHQLKSFLLAGMIFFSSCSQYVNYQSDRYPASSTNDQILLTKGLYPKSLVGRNIIDSEGRAKVVFNLPPYTNPGGIGIVPEMLSTINSAKKSIRMSFFQFNHAEVFNALKKAADRGVKVFITSDLCYTGKIGYKEYFDDLRSYISSKGQNGTTQIIDDATASCETMFNHNKYMIVDYEDSASVKAWFGSFNPTNHGSVENVELAIVAQDKKLADILMLDFDQQISGKFKVYKKGVYTVKEGNNESIMALSEDEIKAKIASNILVTYPKVRIGDVEFEMILSPKVKSLSRIVEEVYSAKSEILFSSFAIADQMLISSLINKSNTTDSKYNLFSVLSLPHPYDVEGYNFVKNGDINNQVVIFKKSEKIKNPGPEVTKQLAPIVDEVKASMSTPANYLTPKGELKGTFKYIYPKGTLGGEINKVHIEGIFNSKVIDEKNTYQRLASFKIPLVKSSMYGELHNKLFLIDESTTIFGSHNFSQSAENSNDELTVIIKSSKLAKFLKDELYSKTKLFSASEFAPETSYSSEATIAITEIMAESKYKMAWNKKQADIGDYIEIFNYGDQPVNMLGFRIDDHFFPSNDGEVMEGSTFPGYQGALARLIPSKENGKLGSVDYNTESNILGPKKVGLIVGKYFNESLFKDRFIEVFKSKFNRMPDASEFPMLFTSSEYYSAVLGDSTQGLTSKDKISIFGVDGLTVIDRFAFPKQTVPGTSLERTIELDKFNSYFKARSYELEIKNFSLKNGTKLIDKTIMPNFPFIEENRWSEATGGTPGVVMANARYVASAESVYTIEGEIVDVESNTFKKGFMVVSGNKIIDVTTNLGNYPKPILKDVLIFPGLIDAHNHIKYNTMPIWKVNKVYDNRNQWPEDSVYKSGVKELYKKVYMEWPECTMTDELELNKCLAKNRCLVMKYAELKALIGGTTSIQGSSSFDETSSDITFKGLSGYTAGSGNKVTKSKARIAEDLIDSCSSDLARNIERELWHGKDEVRTTAQSIFSDAFARKSITDEKKFKQTPSGRLLDEFKNRVTNTFFIHLGEGKDQSSKSEWSELEYLKLNVPQTTVIHGTAFENLELKAMGEKGISLAWSPTSNLLLYKKTSNIPDALKNKVNVALGSDWSLSGTKSMLDEIKVAKMANQKYFNNVISDIELLKMATINGAKASHLDDLIGSISKNKFADYFLIPASLKAKSPLDTLLTINEDKIDLVAVGGKPIIGKENKLMLFRDLYELDISKVSDTSCSSQIFTSFGAKGLDEILNTLSKKTEDGFKSLGAKFQTGLGQDFMKLDPLCSQNDSRYQSLIKNL